MNAVPPKPSKQFSLSIMCRYCGVTKTFGEGHMPNQVEHFQMAHSDCKPFAARFKKK